MNARSPGPLVKASALLWVVFTILLHPMPVPGQVSPENLRAVTSTMPGLYRTLESAGIWQKEFDTVAVPGGG